ncbi:filamentous hemagglutinin N-terminal domain-containing protein [Trinickia dinghuensis]|uniref:Filamentous hemagglutinin N-terminal domain-containing protein n=1 Tax=Trinickia dinghuensis TaxID=2291023 RepID=A0A3D8JPL2_9BURK|nr:filamentous hemagglutinin N-terminal domain-containing protein [Trinickia dinghuensis]RDU94656.1 filamentous hemagglutinin N-terminal domain-containing protein [Trinickia dinghuensis]
MKPTNSESSASSALSKARSVSAIPFAVAILFASVHAYAGGLLPSGGKFIAGTGSIHGNGQQLTINQTSSRGVIDWTSFMIGNGKRVEIDNGAGATLNRVTGGVPSWILGTLSATGSVYLINPQGVVVGPSGVISTGGRFVASTLDADNTAFMQGGPLTLTGTSTADVVNLGKIGSSGGDVFLVARNAVLNLGDISAPAGSVELAAGQNVLLQDSSTSRQVFVQTGSRGTVTNLGTLQAAQISLQAADGNIYAFSGNHSAIRATGTATRDGHIWLVADTGTVHMSGTLSAKNADGTGGTVDTSASAFAPGLFGLFGATVDAGTWNLAMPSLNVTQPIGAAMTNSLGAGTSLNVNTTQGNIEIGTNLGWKGSAALTLGAYGSIAIDKGVKISNQGAGNLTLRADASGIDNQGKITNNSTLDWSNSAGVVSALYDMNGTYTPGTLLANAAWTPAEGSGMTTQITGYELVNSFTDLQNVSQNLAGNYALGKNLDDGGGHFTPIGNATTPFSGQFDGMGHTINHILIMPVYPAPYASAPLPSGLFGVIGNAGVVRNLSLTNSQSSPVNYVYTMSPGGLLAGINQGHIANVFVSGTLTAWDFSILGGLVGQNLGLIERSAANVTVSGETSDLGGLVGDNGGKIAQCYSTGWVQGIDHPSMPGGLVAYNSGTISQSFVTGAVTGDWMTAPSLAALTAANSGTVTADNYWNVQTTGVNNGGGAPASNGLTTAQMSNAASYVGWDFSANGAWVMPAGATHPVLRWQLAAGSQTQ